MPTANPERDYFASYYWSDSQATDALSTAGNTKSAVGAGSFG